MTEERRGGRGRKLTPEQKNNIAEGRVKARVMRGEAMKFFDKFGELLVSWKFWIHVNRDSRKEIANAIRKAEAAAVQGDIKALQSQLEAKTAEKEALKKN